MMFLRPPNKPARAFTLIELLTVIGIIAILATLLMSSLSGAKKKARMAKCTSQLHQISIALNIYLDDSFERPRGYASLVDSDYLPAKQVLLCPEDKLGNWGNRVMPQIGGSGNLPPPAEGSLTDRLQNGVDLPFSYLHPTEWPTVAWRRIMSRESSAGLSVCQLHGLGEFHAEAPNVRDFEGLVLRAQMDGAVVRRHFYWDAPAEPPFDFASAPGAPDSETRLEEGAGYPFGLFMDLSPLNSSPAP